MLTLALTAELGQLLLAAVDFCIIYSRKSIKKKGPSPTRLLLCNACNPNKKWRVEENK